MANVKISELPVVTADSVLTGKFPVVVGTTTSSVLGSELLAASNLSTIATGEAEVTSAPAHWWVLVGGALKRLTWAGFIVLIKSIFGFVSNEVGFEMAGGTTSKKLTVDADANTSNIPTSGGKTDANAIAATTGATLAARLAAAIAAATTSAQGAVVLTATPADVTTGTNATKALTCAALKTSTPQLSGIAFPATQVPSANANTLDDYVEGTWTPTLIGSTTPGAQTYVGQTGRFTKIGRIVFLTGLVSISAKDVSMAGNVYVGGLPYASGISYAAGSISVAKGITYPLGYTAPVLYTIQGQSYLGLTVNGSAQQDASVAVASIANATYIAFSLFYSV